METDVCVDNVQLLENFIVKYRLNPGSMVIRMRTLHSISKDPHMEYTLMRELFESIPDNSKDFYFPSSTYHYRQFYFSDTVYGKYYTVGGSPEFFEEKLLSTLYVSTKSRPELILEISLYHIERLFDYKMTSEPVSVMLVERVDVKYKNVWTYAFMRSVSGKDTEDATRKKLSMYCMIEYANSDKILSYKNLVGKGLDLFQRYRRLGSEQIAQKEMFSYSVSDVILK
jgi:hypothetical protein